MARIPLHWQILAALALAVPAGLLSGGASAVFGISFVQIFTFLGALFMNALKMLIVPLIVSSMITGVAAIGRSRDFGRFGARTFAYYFSTSLIAILIGLALVNAVEPGRLDGKPVRDLVGLTADGAALGAQLAERDAGAIADVVLGMVPPNVVAAAADGQMLALVFFSLLFGFFLTRVDAEYATPVHNFWKGVFEVMLRITDWVMKFAPLGVFALVAKVVATTGFQAFAPLLLFVFTVLGGLALHFLLVLPALLLVVARVNPLRHYRAMAPALLTAFSTASSSATLPVTLDCTERRAGVSNRTSSFVLPLGASVNMDGTGLYECVAAMFIAQAYGIELSLAQQFTVVALALLTSIGVAGIPAASLVAITIILSAVGLPVEAVALILAVDRPLDMCRTAVNVYSDSVCAVIVARLEGEKDVLAAVAREA